MPLENLSDTGDEEIAIGTICTDVPVRQYNIRFDPARDLTEEDWEEMIKTIPWNDSRNADALITCAKCAAPLRILDRRRVFPFSYDRSHELSEVIQTLRDMVHGMGFGDSVRWKLGEAFAWCCILFPEHRPQWTAELDLDTVGGLWRRPFIARQNLKHSAPSDSDAYLVHTLGCQLFYPEQKEWMGLHGVMREKYRSYFDELREKGWWETLAYKHALFTLCFPDVAKRDVVLTQADIRAIERDFWEKLEEGREKHDVLCWRDVAWTGASLLIHAAQDIRITDHGLELTMPEREFGESFPPLPTLRSF